jgi:hypothetical protein
MKSKSVRLALASVVAVISVLGLTQGVADAKSFRHHHVSRVTDGWCC